MESLSEYIARNHDMRKKFSTLHAEYLEQKRDQHMSNNGYGNSDTHTLNQALPNGGMADPATHKGTTLPPSAPTDTITSGMNVLSQIPGPTATYVNGNELDGDRGGDTRTKSVSNNFSTDFAKNPPCPREPVRQSQVTSSKLQQTPTRIPSSVTGYSEASHT